MDESKNWFEKGVELFERGDYRGAISAFDKALGKNPSMNEAWNNRGLALINTGQYQEAIQSFDKTLVLNPRHENAKKARIIALDLLGDQKKLINPPAPVGQSRASPNTKTGSPQLLIQSPATGTIRDPWYAVIFSFFIAGWGQWYNGRRWDGLKLFGMFALASVLAILLSRNLLGKISVLLIMLGIWIYGMYNAYKTAEQINRGELGFVRKSRLFWAPALLLLLPFVSVFFAILAAFFFGIAANTASDHVIAATAHQTDNRTIIVTYQGGPDANDLRQMRAIISDSYGKRQEKTIGQSGQTMPLEVGSSLTFSGDFVGNDRVILTGIFADGSESIIIETYV